MELSLETQGKPKSSALSLLESVRLAWHARTYNPAAHLEAFIEDDSNTNMSEASHYVKEMIAGNKVYAVNDLKALRLKSKNRCNEYRSYAMHNRHMHPGKIVQALIGILECGWEGNGLYNLSLSMQGDGINFNRICAALLLGFRISQVLPQAIHNFKEGVSWGFNVAGLIQKQKELSKQFGMHIAILKGELAAGLPPINSSALLAAQVAQSQQLSNNDLEPVHQVHSEAFLAGISKEQKDSAEVAPIYS